MARGGNGGNGGSYRVIIDVVPGQIIGYSIGAAGVGGRGDNVPPYSATNGTSAGNISVTAAGVTYTAYGGGGGAMGLYNETSAGANGANGAGGGTGGTGLGAYGGAGGAPHVSGVNGNPGELVFENYQANGLISRPEWEVLIGHLSERFTGYTWP